MRVHIFLLAASLVMLPGCAPRSVEPMATIPVPIQTRNPLVVDRQETVNVSGSVTSPDAASDVPFLVNGRVLRVTVREGDTVRQGQVLAVLDSTDYSPAVNGAKAQVAAAKILLNRAEDEYRRMKMLFDSKSLPPNDFQKFEAAYLAAKEQLNQAIAGEKSARKHLSDATLLAPVNGFISRRSVEPGNMAAAGQPVFQVVTLDPVEVLVGVPETNIHLVRVGQHAQVQIPALPGEAFSGVIRAINVAADNSTRTYSTRIQVPNPKHRLRLGMVAEVQIQGDRRIKALTLPGSAVVHDPQGASLIYVYYPQQNRVYSHRVEVGGVAEQEVVIESGLRPEEQVVIAGQQALRDGTMVQSVSVQTPRLAVSGAEGK